MPASTRVATDAGDVLPIAVIARDVVIDEVHLEEGRAVTPVETEFVHEATRRDLPAAVAHPARLHQLAHQRVDQRVIGVARAPARDGPQLEAARRAVPADAVRREQAHAIDAGAPVEELAPQQFLPEPARGLVARFVALEAQQLQRYLACRPSHGDSQAEA